jgi:hypothetical protein
MTAPVNVRIDDQERVPVRGGDGRFAAWRQPSIRERIKSLIKVDDAGCWNWQGYLRVGYGTLSIDGRPHLAHRVSYMAYVGPIPVGLHIDHLCRNRRCVNPQHLEPVTPAENNRRAAAVKTRCPQGHPYDPSNTYVHHNKRHCKSCVRERGRTEMAKEQTKRRMRGRRTAGNGWPRTPEQVERRREYMAAYHVKRKAAQRG